MRNNVETLRRAKGQQVGSAVAHLVFYSVETRGTLISMSLRFVDGLEFQLGCVGDGSVYVSQRQSTQVGNAPYFASEHRVVPSVSGLLTEILRQGNTLSMTIGDRLVQLTNDDDELSVTLDGVELPETFFER